MDQQRSHPQRNAGLRTGLGREEGRLGKSALRLVAKELVTADNGLDVDLTPNRLGRFAVGAADGDRRGDQEKCKSKDGG
jgi:hypothetical protein